MKKFFTLISMAFVAMSVSAQDAVGTELPENYYPAKNIVWAPITWKNGNNKKDKDNNDMLFLMGTGNGQAKVYAEAFWSEDKGADVIRPAYTYIDYEKDEDNREITFTYTGDGKVTDWEFPGMTLGVDYEIVERGDNWIKIRISEDYDGDVIADAIVEEPTSEETTLPESTTAETTKKNEDQKSPATGASVAAGVAAMGAGAAILAALKRKNDAE
jgi:hypothetical protein